MNTNKKPDENPNRKSGFQGDALKIISIILIGVLITVGCSYVGLAAGMEKIDPAMLTSESPAVQETKKSSEESTKEAKKETKETKKESESAINSSIDLGASNEETAASVEVSETDETTLSPDPTIASIQLEVNQQEARNSAEAAMTYIQELSDEELEGIEGAFDSTLQGFGLGLGQKDTDKNNRPLQVLEVQQQFENAGVDGIFFCGDSNEKKVAITFQAYYDTGYADDILDILDEYHVGSTFYIAHNYAESEKKTVARMIASGHEIGNHSYACPDDGVATWSLKDQMKDALKMQLYMQQAYGYNMRKYNFNGGYWTMASAEMYNRMGYEVCFCSVNYDDYDVSETFDSAEVLKDMKSKLHNGAVYCFHMTNKVTVDILPRLIEYIRGEGYKIVQLP